jgi:hypothetical protein
MADTKAALFGKFNVQLGDLQDICDGYSPSGSFSRTGISPAKPVVLLGRDVVVDTRPGKGCILMKTMAVIQEERREACLKIQKSL